MTFESMGHSPSDLACTSQYMLKTTKLNRVLEVTNSFHLLFWSSYVLCISQVNTEKLYVVAQAGITLNDLHAQLAKNNLAMTNVGSISEQTLGGVVATATHGTGITYGVLSTQVRALSLLLADGSRTSCSRTDRPDLFLATICGLGATGIILSVQLDVEPIFRLKEMQQSLSFDEVVQNFDHHVHLAEHVRFWWFPTMDVVMCSYSNRTKEVKYFFLPAFSYVTKCSDLNNFLGSKPRRKLAVEFINGLSRHPIPSLHRTLFPIP